MKAGRIPLIPYFRPGHPAVAEMIRPLAPQVRGVMLARIGPTFWHQSVSAAAHARRPRHGRRRHGQYGCLARLTWVAIQSS